MHGIETAYYAEKPAWHGLGVVTKEALNSVDAMKMACLDWEVGQQPIFLKDGTQIEERVANVRSSDNRVLGVVSPYYKVVQPAEAFQFVDAILENDEVEVKIESAGSLFQGKKIWILARLPSRFLAGDECIPYLVFATSFDGSLASTAGLLYTRVVCDNTLTMGIAGAVRLWRFDHSGDVNQKRAEASRTLRLSNHYFDLSEELAERYTQISVSKEALNDLIEAVFPINEKLDSDRVKDKIHFMRNNFLDIYSTKGDLQKFKGTAWGVYNAMSDFTSHIKPLRITKTFQDSQFQKNVIEGNKLLTMTQKVLEGIAA